MDQITDLPEFIRTLGANFAAWRRYQLHDVEKLTSVLSNMDAKYTTLLGRFENGILADFIQAAADSLCVSPETFLNPPPEGGDIIQLPSLEEDRDLEEERQIEKLSWSKWDKNTDYEKLKAFRVTLRYGEEHGLSEDEQDYLARMLIAPPHHGQDKYKKSPKRKCCKVPQVVSVDSFTVERYDPHEKIVGAIMYCTNCGLEWMENKNGEAQQTATSDIAQLPAAV